MRRRPVLLAALGGAALLAAGTAGAAPVSPAPAPVPSGALAAVTGEAPACLPAGAQVGDRIFPEPAVAGGWLRFEEFACGVEELERRYPDLVEVTTTGTSRAGHAVYDVLLTDETVVGPKRKLLVVSSIHGDEIGAREGAARVLEEMVDPDLKAGEDFVQQVLDRYVIHFLFPNPDGWVEGDVVGQDAGVSWTRGNSGGRDLNRNFPVQGYISAANRTLQEPESQGIRETLLEEDGRGGKGGWYLGTDNHGQLTDTYAAAGLQIVGQFDYEKSETLARFADGITRSMADYPVLRELDQVGTATGTDVGPYHWGTLYDMLGYSASGSLIDYYNTPGLTDGYGFATELTIGKTVAGNFAAWDPARAQVWVDSIRAINYEMFRQAVDVQDHVFPLESRTAYVVDPAVVTDSDADGAGYERRPGEDIPQEPYEATRMTFFEDLSEDASQPLHPLRVKDVVKGAKVLDEYDSLVLADSVMPEPADRTEYVAALKGFVERGGNLVVTDAAAPVLAELGLVAPGDIAMTRKYVGYVDFGDRSLPLNAGLRGVASQTYDTVPIGYAFGGSNTAPNWTVSSAAWSAAGGTTAGTQGAGRTVYGEAPLGEGTVRFLGALLPQPTEAHYHPYGLQDYAVTYTGYTLLENVLRR